jgi:hypothetical protein
MQEVSVKAQQPIIDCGNASIWVGSELQLLYPNVGKESAVAEYP